MLSLIWLSTEKEEQAEEVETVIIFSLGRDEDYRAAWQSVRQRGTVGEIEEKRGRI